MKFNDYELMATRSYVRRISTLFDAIMTKLANMEEVQMATWDDVKAAAAKNAEVDVQVLAFIADVKKTLDELRSLPAGPSGEEFAAVADTLNARADEVAAAIADKPVVVEPAPEPVVEPAPETPVE